MGEHRDMSIYIIILCIAFSCTHNIINLLEFGDIPEFPVVMGGVKGRKEAG